LAEIIGQTALLGRLNAVRTISSNGELLRKLAVAVVAEGKREAPRRTGNLARSIAPAEITGTSAQIRVSAGYAAFVEFGTRPHVIRPKTKKVLAWSATAGGRRLTGSLTKAARAGSMGLGGKGGIKMVGPVGPSSGPVIFAREVHHPGTAPNPFMARGGMLAIQKAGLMDIIVGAWNSGA
jgi:hypothetical protein